MNRTYRCLSLLISSFLFFPLLGQNLVLNPSLEQFNAKTKYPIHWKKVNLTPDIFGPNKEYSDENGKRRYAAHLLSKKTYGNSCAGLLFSHFFTEAIQVELARPMVRGGEYEVSLYVLCPRNYVGRGIHEVSVYFSTKQLPKIGATGNYKLKYTPLTSSANYFLESKEEWVKVSGYYIAQGGERYLTIANFEGANQSILASQAKSVVYRGELGVPLVGMYLYLFDNVEVREKYAPAGATSEPFAFDNKVQIVTPVPVYTKPAATPHTNMPIPRPAAVPPPTPAPIKPYTNLAEQLPSTSTHIHFSSGNAFLDESAFRAIDSLYEVMLKMPTKKLILNGHSYEEGDAKAMSEISLKRAQSVMNYLVSKGLPMKRIACKGNSTNKPLTTEKSTTAKMRNRRVDWEVVEMPTEKKK